MYREGMALQKLRILKVDIYPPLKSISKDVFPNGKMAPLIYGQKNGFERWSLCECLKDIQIAAHTNLGDKKKTSGK